MVGAGRVEFSVCYLLVLPPGVQQCDSGHLACDSRPGSVSTVGPPSAPHRGDFTVCLPEDLRLLLKELKERIKPSKSKLKNGRDSYEKLDISYPTGSPMLSMVGALCSVQQRNIPHSLPSWFTM